MEAVLVHHLLSERRFDQFVGAKVADQANSQKWGDQLTSPVRLHEFSINSFHFLLSFGRLV